MNKLLKEISTLVVAAAVTSLVSIAQAQIRYVDDDAPLGGDGQSWSTPYKFLWDALIESAAGFRKRRRIRHFRR